MTILKTSLALGSTLCATSNALQKDSTSTPRVSTSTSALKILKIIMLTMVATRSLGQTETHLSVLKMVHASKVISLEHMAAIAH
jgi:hypothetical protein